jgi:hypothetical protein
VSGTPTETHQDLNCQQYDEKGNIISLIDNLNSINHSHTYDSLDRLLTTTGAGNNPYSQNYQYNRIGNITYKSDVGSYTYTYSNIPGDVDENRYFTSLGNCDRRFLCLGKRD